MQYEKVLQEIDKYKAKATEIQQRLKELESLKTDIENKQIVAIMRSTNVPPEKLRAFIDAYKDQFEKKEVKPHGNEETQN